MPNGDEVTYEERREVALANLDRFESDFYSVQTRSNNGQEGQMNSLEAGLTDLDGGEVISGLRQQGLSNIANGMGANARFSLADHADRGAEVFLRSLASLKVEDILPYIGERMDADVAPRYEDRTLEELGQGTDEEKEYAEYLSNVIQLAVKANTGTRVYSRRAELATGRYLESSDQQ